MKVSDFYARLAKEIGKVYIGKEKEIRLLITAVLSGGHVLLNDLPGTGKTTLIKTISKAMGCDFQRIQFTPDLLPSDIIGMTIFDQETRSFRTIRGPVFTHVLLADEINRAIPRTQSALLEAMEEKQVTIDRESFPLPEPFLVLATQNPVEQESTFRLPQSQMDRFFMQLSLGYPDPAEEIRMLEYMDAGALPSAAEQVGSPEDLLSLRQETESVHVSEHVRKYIVDLIGKTREDKRLLAGASPRTTKSLYTGARTYAAIEGRNYVLPEDVKTIFLPCLTHRILLSPDSAMKRLNEEKILQDILDTVPVPPSQEESLRK